MGPNTMGNGISDKPLERENFTMWMGTSMRVSGPITKRMVMAFILILKVRGMKVNGKMTSNMEKGLRFGMRAPNMMDITQWARKKELENIYGQMVQLTMVNGLITA